MYIFLEVRTLSLNTTKGTLCGGLCTTREKQTKPLTMDHLKVMVEVKQDTKRFWP